MSKAATTGPPPAEPSKAAWRRWARAQRRALADADPERRADAAIAAHLGSWEPWRTARVALVYLAFGSEVDPLTLGLAPAGAHAAAVPARATQAGGARADGATAGTAQAGGPRLATTRTPSGGGPLHVHAYLPDALERHALGFLQPRADAPLVPLEAIDLALVPGLCFDASGCRLGYGRGYYDQFLPRLPARVVTVGVTRAALVVERLPTEAHDVAVGWLLTEAGVRRAGG